LPPPIKARVVAHSAAEHVGGSVAGQDIVAFIASGVDRDDPGQHRILDLGKGIAGQIDGAVDAHRVGSLVGELGDCIEEAVDHVGVITRPASHAVGPGSTVESVVAQPARERVVAASADDEIVAVATGNVDRTA